MSKKANSSIYHLENYIQMLKLNCILKIRFNNDELTPRARKNQNTSYDRNKIRHFNLLWGQDIHAIFTRREGKGVNV